MCKCSVDRIEGNFAVLENNGKFIEIRLEELPSDIKEGTILCKDKNGFYFIDDIKTEDAKSKLFEMQNSLFYD